ncbi:lytic transglycosylase domain-containing protein [Herbiconiux moechotypicola]|uniref:Lytic transglycosylase domain-containing protein n=1 Tax=Herbiconiux moechotypicola TaxID=637393 RepID=A0ABP5QGL2_9MICO|nr:lytic transglycosylase domain-containing protein [Herbiconiux moechotypicola]MCS5729763.1 lytic transglycosylase domain-containing protein [Herbiconiux moechotypicola]
MTVLKKSTRPVLRAGVQVLAFGVAASFVALFALQPALTQANASEAYAPDMSSSYGSVQSLEISGAQAASVLRDDYTITDPPPPPAPEPVKVAVSASAAAESSSGGGGCESYVVPTPGEPAAGSYQDIAWTSLKGYGFGIQQYYYLLALWNRESGWNPAAHNASSGAHGIPQALPGSKMGPGWESDPNVQIDWGIRYILGSYGSPCEAWAHSEENNWY